MKAELLIVRWTTDIADSRLELRSAGGPGLGQVGFLRRGDWSHHPVSAFDTTMSSVALVLVSSMVLAKAVAIRLNCHGPVTLLQMLAGRGEECFAIHKLCSAGVDAEPALGALSTEPIGNDVLSNLEDNLRAIRMGRKLRSFSLGESPQFWTVPHGLVSVVGPGRHVESELAEFPKAGLCRLRIKPDVPGLWQAERRSSVDLEESIRLDLRYVENCSLSVETAIILTPPPAFRRRGGAYCMHLVGLAASGDPARMVGA